jgi:hypothetical protein
MKDRFPMFKKACTLLLAMALVTASNLQLSAEKNETVSPSPIIASYDQDLALLKRLRGNLVRLSDEVKARDDLFGPKSANDTTLLRHHVRTQVLAIWYPLLDNYMALDALAEKHMQFHRLKDKKARKRAFHLARGVFLTQYRFALDVIAVLEQNPVVDTILNETDMTLGLPQGVYAQFKYQYLNVVKAGRYAALEAVAKVYKTAADARLAQWAKEDSRVILAAGRDPGPKMTFKNGISIVQRYGHQAWFPIQKGVAEWMGHTKVWRPHQYLIGPKQITMLSRQLSPGDILLERREWYMTNVGIPGFWTHAALFIGSSAHRDALSRDPHVQIWLEKQGAQRLDDLIHKRHPQAHAAMQIPCKDGHLPQVIEALSPGVSLTSLEQSAACDSLAVLRPRLSKAARAAAVVRAMRYYSRPYDYDFDFGSDRSLVCTELVVKSYLPGESQKGLQLPLERLMGRMVTPANAFVRQFDETFGTGDQQMDLILFLDGNEKTKNAVEAGAAAFCQSWTRPKWHILLNK